jgi:membrane protein
MAHQMKPQQPFPKKTARKSVGPMSGGLIVMAALVGLSRVLFGQKQGRVQNTLEGLGDAVSGKRGRLADKPSDIPAKGWTDIAWRLYDGLQDDRILLVAAGVTFYALLALFPATAAVVSLYGLFTDATTINEHLQLLSGFLPEGALSMIGDQVKRIASHGETTLGVTFMGTLILSWWGANAGTKAIFDALNIIYKEREKRGFFQLTFKSLLFTLAGLALIVIAITGVVAVPVALKLLGIPRGSGTAFLTLLRWPLLYAVILFALACLYRYGPSRTHPRWRWVTWGSAIAAAIWIAGSLLLSWFVANFGTYNATYGSLGAAIGFMIWMWLSTIIILVGGEINAEIEHQTSRDTTAGRHKPVGARGAVMADQIGPTRST